MPLPVQEHNQQSRFRVWANTMRHLLEQVGYYQRRNCMRLVVYEMAVMIECMEATERLEEEIYDDRRGFILCVPCRDEQESLRSFDMSAVVRLATRAY